MKKLPILLVISTLLMACQPTDNGPRHDLTPAFYHWKTTFHPTNFEQRTLRRLGVEKLYVRFFDVDWNPQINEATPKATVRFATPTAGYSVVPVVFITNRTLQNLSVTGIPILARNIANEIKQIAKKQVITFQEVQIDCDWSETTGGRYFALLRSLRAMLGVPLSATIRLHQVKFAAKTGVPPVERGMLMAYNVADWKRADTHNSIWDAAVADRYLPFLSNYPLPLDVVLPIFRWTIAYRNGRFLKILNNMDSEGLKNSAFLESVPSDSTRFVARQDTAAMGMMIRRGDVFRAEAVTVHELTKAQHDILSRIQNRAVTFGLYHLDSTNLAQYSHETLQSLYRPVP
jgi:hypothetical protein